MGWSRGGREDAAGIGGEDVTENGESADDLTPEEEAWCEDFFRNLFGPDDDGQDCPECGLPFGDPPDILSPPCHYCGAKNGQPSCHIGGSHPIKENP